LIQAGNPFQSAIMSFIQRQTDRASRTFHAYPRSFWLLVAVTMIDRLGGTLIYPFFSLYLTGRFGVGMSEVGLLFAVFSASSLIGSFLGGSLTDRMGRRWMIIVSLVATSLTALGMGLVSSMQAFFVIAFVSGLFAEAGSPAYHSVVADVLPQEQRAEGFAILRVGMNLAAAVGPLLGGFLATRSYLGLFVADAIISLLAAALVFGWLPETRPQDAGAANAPAERAGYARVFRDASFMLFFGVCTLTWLTYVNLDTTLGVYLRDGHGLLPGGYGVILALNALMVLLLQFWVTRRAERYPPMLMMALGAVLYGIGFGLYGVVSSYAAFLAAMAVATLGEMVTVPLSNALVANLAPAHMRGRYNAVFGISWTIPFMIGPYLGGLILDNYNPDWLWYACALIGGLAALGFILLHQRLRLSPLQIPLEQDA
jgi:MFS family permease